MAHLRSSRGRGNQRIGSNYPPHGRRKIHPVFNESLLTPFVPANFPSQKKPDAPPPIIVEGEEEYEVEELMDSKVVHGKIKYLVKWKGYLDKADWTWEPEEKILEDNRKEFHEKHSGAPRRIHAILPFREINTYKHQSRLGPGGRS